MWVRVHTLEPHHSSTANPNSCIYRSHRLISVAQKPPFARRFLSQIQRDPEHRFEREVNTKWRRHSRVCRVSLRALIFRSTELPFSPLLSEESAWYTVLRGIISDWIYGFIIQHLIYTYPAVFVTVFIYSVGRQPVTFNKQLFIMNKIALSWLIPYRYLSRCVLKCRKCGIVCHVRITIDRFFFFFFLY